MEQLDLQTRITLCRNRINYLQRLKYDYFNLGDENNYNLHSQLLVDKEAELEQLLLEFNAQQ